ncbi:minor capsid protein [Actinomadura sp. 21ATH]|uniref:phage tail terminator protein n=1 Tax=Actinomadura sp. 21ATH TaxID=1735444 RepID=UPI0035C04E97
MSWTEDLLAGLAAHLAAQGVGQWQPAGAYTTATPPPITLRTLPDAFDRAYAIGAYVEVELEDAGLSDVTVGVQVRSRGTTDPDSVEEAADAVWGVLHGARMLTLGTGDARVYTSLIYRRSTALLGVDRQGRYERSCSYFIHASRPNAYRPD